MDDAPRMLGVVAGWEAVAPRPAVADGPGLGAGAELDALAPPPKLNRLDPDVADVVAGAAEVAADDGEVTGAVLLGANRPPVGCEPNGEAFGAVVLDSGLLALAGADDAG